MLVAHTMNAKGGSGRSDFESETFIVHALRAEGFDASEDGTGRGTPIVPVAFDCKAGGNTSFSVGELPGALRGTGHGGGHAALAFAQNTRNEVRLVGGDGQPAGALAAEPGMKQTTYVAQAFDMRGREGGSQFEVAHDAEHWGVRRLTPRECERLQGVPDDYTAIPWRGKPASECPDGPRYKAIGNSRAVPVVRWIGERLKIAIEARRAA